MVILTAGIQYATTLTAKHFLNSIQSWMILQQKCNLYWNKFTGLYRNCTKSLSKFPVIKWCCYEGWFKLLFGLWHVTSLCSLVIYTTKRSSTAKFQPIALVQAITFILRNTRDTKVIYFKRHKISFTLQIFWTCLIWGTLWTSDTFLLLSEDGSSGLIIKLNHKAYLNAVRETNNKYLKCAVPDYMAGR